VPQDWQVPFKQAGRSKSTVKTGFLNQREGIEVPANASDEML
jgi:hypothetical protein